MRTSHRPSERRLPPKGKKKTDWCPGINRLGWRETFIRSIDVNGKQTPGYIKPRKVRCPVCNRRVVEQLVFDHDGDCATRWPEHKTK